MWEILRGYWKTGSTFICASSHVPYLKNERCQCWPLPLSPPPCPHPSPPPSHQYENTAGLSKGLTSLNHWLFKSIYCWVTLNWARNRILPRYPCVFLLQICKLSSWEISLVGFILGQRGWRADRTMAASLWMVLLCLLMHGSFCEGQIQKGCMKWSSDETNDTNVCCDICFPGE